MKKTATTPQTLFSYAESASNQLKANEQARTGRAYMTAVRRFTGFVGNKDLEFSQFTTGTMNRFQTFLEEDGLRRNTISFYMRNLRAIFNRASKDGLVRQKAEGIFDDVFTGVDDTSKRALTQEEMERLSALRAEEKEIYESLLYFLFCFHGRGISFVDLCFLRKKHIREGAIYYNRKKTGKQLVVMITEPMQEILDYFSGQVVSSPYLFPILNEKGISNVRAQYENALCKQNRRLKVVGKMAGIPTTLSTHVARHTWATFAYRKGTSIGVVSQALGHRDERTTAIYLASFEVSVIDQLSVDVSNMITQGRTKRLN